MKLPTAPDYTQYLPLVRNLAAKFAAKYRKPYDDMEEAATEAYHIAFAQWTPYDKDGRPDFRNPMTYFYYRIYWHLMTVCTRTPQLRSPFYTHTPRGVGARLTFARKPTNAALHSLAVGNEVGLDVPAKQSPINALLQHMGDDARMVVSIFREAPGELAQEISHLAPKRSKEAVISYLKQSGWAVGRIERAFGEVQLCVTSA